MRGFALTVGLWAGCTLIVNGQLGECGDGLVQGGNSEQCDDGNNQNGDGCSADCQLEALPSCGNGVFDAGELCRFQREELQLGNSDLGPTDLLLRELDGDGRVDAVILFERSGGVLVLRNQAGEGKEELFAVEQTITVPLNTSEILVEDFNGDGLLDLVTLNDVIGEILAFSGVEGGTFTEQGAIQAANLGALGGAAAGDVDGDENVDLVVTQTPLSDAVILIGALEDSVNLQLVKSFEVLDQPGAVALGDMDNDGALDLVVASREGDDVEIVQNGLEGLAEGDVFPVSDEEDQPIALLIDDFDGNTTRDLAVVNRGSDSVSIFFDPLLGAGNLQAPPLKTSDRPSAVAAGDLDRDGDNDLVVAHESGVDVFLNEGGSFRVFEEINLDDEVASVAVGDVNGDGALDIVVSVPDDDEIFILLSTP